MEGEMSKNNQFSATVTTILPAGRLNLENRIPRAYAGISLRHPAFSGGRFAAYLKWVDNHVQECRFILGDRLHRFNVMAEFGVGEKEAAGIADDLGRAVLGKLESSLMQLRHTRYEVLRWADVATGSAFSAAHAQILSVWKTDERFRERLYQSSAEYLSRHASKYHRVVRPDEALILSCSYLMEEMAVFAVQVDSGWPVEIYPGPELGVLEDALGGLHAGLPEALKKRVNVAIDITPVARS
jgi:tRNA-dependent cyclodipeptide synthase